MPTSIASGTQTAVVTTEHTLATDTSNATFVLVVDTANLTVASGVADVVELRIYTIALSAGAERLAYTATYVGIQGDPIKYSVPVPADISFKATLKQTAGTARQFPWKVLSL
jgi:hypothetical protein